MAGHDFLMELFDFRYCIYGNSRVNDRVTLGTVSVTLALTLVTVSVSVTVSDR